MSNPASKEPKVANVPNLRFPKFAGGYSQKRFTEAFVFLKNNTFSREMMNDEAGDYRNVHYGDILTKLPTLVDCENVTLPFINNDISVSPKLNLLRTGDVIIADTAEDYTVGKAIEIKNGTSKVISGLHTIPCRAKISFYNGYLGYYLNSFSFRNNLLPLVQGIKVYSISKGMLELLVINYPCLEEQEKITNLLLDIDARIETQNKIIEGLEVQRNQIRNRVFNKIRGKERTLADILSFEQPTKYLVQSNEYSDDEKLTPVLTANKAFILGFTNEKEGVFRNVPCIIFDDFTMDSKFVSFPFKVKSSAIKILKGDCDEMTRFAYEFLKNQNLSSAEHKRHYISEVSRMAVVVPDANTMKALSGLFAAIERKIEVEKAIANCYQIEKQYFLCNLFI